MSDFIIDVSAQNAVWTVERPMPIQSVLLAEYNNGIEDRQAYLSTDAADWSAIQHIVIGEWCSVTGENLRPVHPDYFTFIRPLGNENGKATDVLHSMKWQGHSSEKYVEYVVDDTDPDDVIITAERYPQTYRPFTLKIERTYIDTDPWPGWSWTVEAITDSPTRDLLNMAIGIYSDRECTQYLYTTGKFSEDAEGKRFTTCPVGQRLAAPEPIYFAHLLGAEQQGIYALDSLEDGATSEALFWQEDVVWL